MSNLNPEILTRLQSINRFLEDIYSHPRRLSDILYDAGMGEDEITRLRRDHLETTMTTDATHNTDPSPPRQGLDKPSGRGPSEPALSLPKGRGFDPAARDDAGSRRDADPTDDEPNVAFTFSSRDAEESLRSFNETLDELWTNTVAIQVEQMERTVQQIGFRYSLPAWLPDRLAWWLAERWPAEWLPTLDRRRVGRARQDHEH